MVIAVTFTTSNLKVGILEITDGYNVHSVKTLSHELQFTWYNLASWGLPIIAKHEARKYVVIRQPQRLKTK